MRWSGVFYSNQKMRHATPPSAEPLAKGFVRMTPPLWHHCTAVALRAKTSFRSCHARTGVHHQTGVGVYTNSLRGYLQTCARHHVKTGTPAKIARPPLITPCPSTGTLNCWFLHVIQRACVLGIVCSSCCLSHARVCVLTFLSVGSKPVYACIFSLPDFLEHNHWSLKGKSSGSQNCTTLVVATSTSRIVY